MRLSTGTPDDVPAPDRVGAAVARLSDDTAGGRERVAALGVLSRALGAGAVTGRALVSALVRALEEAGPHLPVRDLLTLREHHGGLSGDELAQSLVRSASRATAAVGAAGGTASAVSVAAPPALLATPVALAAETLAVVAIELKLVAELHVVFGRAPQGSRSQVAAAYLSAWVAKKGLAPDGAPPAVGAVLTAAVRQQLRSRVVRRLGRNLSTLAPLLTGAVAAAELNRRETVKLGEALRADLAPKAPPAAAPARPWDRLRRR